MKPIAIGTDDFKEIREDGSLFIDKTYFIRDIIDDNSKVLLFPRPRRFGKTLNMSMLRYYFDNTLDSKYMFDGLKIMTYGEKYLNEMNKYPIISLTLKECKKGTYDEFIVKMKTIIFELYSNYKFLLESDKIEKVHKDYFQRCMNKEEEVELSLAIYNLSYMLEKYYNRQVIVLLDEYDAPIIESYIQGYYKECISFMRDVFSSTFKGNLSLKKGVITGILRVSKEGMFSGANNINIYNITDYKFSNSFGFTEEEVQKVLKEYEISDKYPDVKTWYDGYNFSGNTIYNPWSIIKYLDDSEHLLKVYWANTGGTDLLRKLIYSKNNEALLEEYHKLLETNMVNNVNLDLEMDLKSLDNDRNTIWTLFMLAGYLTVDGNDVENVTLRIPNKEIKKNLTNICINWFNKNISNSNYIEEDLMYHNMDDFKDTLEKIVEESFSYYDVDRRYGENFYHAFVMGLLYSSNSNFKITSNREAGFGRYDLLLKPINDSCNYAYIIEFKSIEKDNFDETIDKAFKQIEEKNYEAEIKEYNVTKIVVVFKYKEIKIEIR